MESEKAKKAANKQAKQKSATAIATLVKCGVENDLCKMHGRAEELIALIARRMENRRR